MKVAVLDDYQGVAARHPAWARLPAEVSCFTDHEADTARLAQRLADFEVVVAMRERTSFGPALLARLPSLRLLVTTGRSNAAIDISAARAAGVVVCHTTAWPKGTAELTWLLILALLRRLPAEEASLRQGAWQRHVGDDLAGKTLGLLGFGELGRLVARPAPAFDVDVLAWSPHLTADVAAADGARLVPKAELFSRSDIVSIHLRLAPATAGIVGAGELELLGPGGYLVNTSRAQLVDTPALATALRERTIAGAALDVFDHEPLPAGDPLLDVPNTVLTPHIGFVTRRTYDGFFQDVVEDIEAYTKGRPVRRLC